MQTGDENPSQGGDSKPIKATTPSRPPSSPAPIPGSVPIAAPKPQGALLKKRPVGTAPIPGKARSDTGASSQPASLSSSSPNIATQTNAKHEPAAEPTSSRRTKPLPQPPKEEEEILSAPTDEISSKPATDVSSEANPEVSQQVNHFKLLRASTQTTPSAPRNSGNSPRQPLGNKRPAQSPRSESRPVAVAVPAAQKVEVKAVAQAQPKVPKEDPMGRVKKRRAAQTKSLQKLGTKPAPHPKSVAQIKAASKYFDENSNRMQNLRALLPNLKKKTPLVLQPDLDPSHSEDTQSSPKKPDSNTGSTIISGSSPDTTNSPVALLANVQPRSSGSGSASLDSSPEHTKKAQQPTADSQAHSNIKLEEPLHPQEIEAEPLQAAPLKSTLSLVPVRNLFKKAEIDAIAAENNLANKRHLLAPLNQIIFRLLQLQAEFNDNKSLRDPIANLHQYYEDARNQLLNAKTPEERLAALPDEAYVVGDSLDYVVIDRGKYESSSARGRKILCHRIDGKPEKGDNEFGARAGGVHCDNYMKANPAGNYLRPLMEQMIQALYALAPQDDDRPTGVTSTGIKILHASINENPDPVPDPQLEAKLKYYQEDPTIERFVQCGPIVNGMDFLPALRALGAFSSWQNAFSKDELIAHLKTLEELHRNNPEDIKDYKKWPKPLVENSGRAGYTLASLSADIEVGQLHVAFKNGQLQYAVKGSDLQIRKGSISVDQLPALNQLTEPFDLNQLKPLLPDILTITHNNGHTKPPYSELAGHFDAFHNLIPNYTPERAITELPEVLNRIDHRAFSSLFFANLLADPSDLTPPNLRLTWKLEADGTYSYWLVCIDADQALEFPVSFGSGLHYPVIKCVLFMMRNHLDRPIDPKFRDKLLEYTPLQWELFWSRCIYDIDQVWQQLADEEVVGEEDRFEDRENQAAQPEEPASMAARPRPKNPNTRPMALDIPPKIHYKRLPINLATRERLHAALLKYPNSTLRDLLRIAKPEIAVYYETECESVLRPENPADSLLEGFQRVTKQARPFELVFLNLERDIIPALQKHHPNQKFGADSHTLKLYRRLVADTNKPETPVSEHLKTIEDLTKECFFDSLGGKSLFDILADHHIPTNEHENPVACVAIPRAIQLFVDGLGKSLPTETADILELLDTLGEHFPKVNFKLGWLSKEKRAQLIHEAIATAKSGAIKVLAKDNADFTVRNALGETGLHTLMRTHRDHDPEKLIAALTACLSVSTCDPELDDDQNQCTPLMTLVANADENSPILTPEPGANADKKTLTLTEKLIALFVEKKKTRLDQRSAFMRPGFRGEPQPGTALDYAIHLDKPNTFVALINQGAGDVVDVNAAIAFAQRYQDNPKVAEAIETLKALCPHFDYEFAIRRISTAKPDDLHPAECVIEGSNRSKRYLLKSVWDQLFSKKVDVKDKKQRKLIAKMSTKVPDALHPAECIIDVSSENKKTRYLAKTEWDKLWSKTENDPNSLFVKKVVPNNKNSVGPGTHVVVPVKLEGVDKPVAYVAFGKFYPEIPGFQEFVSDIHSRFGSPGSIYSGAWNLLSPDGKEIPLQFSNPIHGPSLNVILKDEEHYNEILSNLDHYKTTLLALLELLYGQEDGHAAQYKLRSTRLSSFLVNVDSDHSFVPAFLPTPDGKMLYIKDIIFLLAQVLKQALDPQAIETVLFANGKKIPLTPSKMEEINSLLHENAETLFDELARDIKEIEEGHLRLYRSRGKTTSTMTGPELMADPSKVRSIVRDIQKRLEDLETQQNDKAKTTEERRRDQNFIEKAKETLRGKLNLVLELESHFSIIGVPLEKNTFAKLYERFRKLQKLLLRRAMTGSLTFMEVMKDLRPDLYREYNAVITANPDANPYELFKILTKDLYQETCGKDGEPVSTSSSYDLFRAQSVSNKYQYQNTGTWTSVDTPIAVYHASKQELKELEPHALTKKADIEALKALATDAQKENFINSVLWARGKSAFDSAMIETIIKEGIQFTHLKLHNCQVLSWLNLKKILENAGGSLETLDLSGCTGIDSSILAFLAECCPNLQTLILNNTTVTSLDEVDCAKLPFFTKLAIRGNISLRSVKFKDPGCKVLDFEGCSALESIGYRYDSKHALERPIEEERPLKFLNLKGCSNLPSENVEAIIDRAPLLKYLHLKDNPPINVRAFVMHARAQGRFNEDVFQVMLQNGHLNLFGIDFTDEELEQIKQWIKKPKNSDKPLKVTGLTARGCCLLSREAIPGFVADPEMKTLTGLTYQGPIRSIRTCGQYTWDMGLKEPVGTYLKLSNGAIFAAAQWSNKTGLVEYNVRMPTDDDKNHESRGYKNRRDKYKVPSRSLPKGTELRGVAEMADGTLLLSTMKVQGNKPNTNPTELQILDLLTHKTVPLNIPELKSKAGKLCVLDKNTFALHSDQLYIIQKDAVGWHIKHTSPGAAPTYATPLIKGPGNLVAYSVDDQRNRRLCIMNYKTGVPVYNEIVSTGAPIKPLYFLDEERFLFFDGDFYAVLHIGSGKIDKLERDETSKTKDPKFIWATPLPTGEIAIGDEDRIVKYDRRTMTRITREGTRLEDLTNLVVTSDGDLLMRNDKGELLMEPSRFFVPKLDFRAPNQRGYELSVLDGEPRIVQITTPDQIIPPSLDIDDGAEASQWAVNMVSGKPTSNTLYEVIYAFFEKYDAYDSTAERQKQNLDNYVSCVDNKILIKGLNDAELKVLEDLLKSFFNFEPKPAMSPHRQFSMMPPPKPLSQKRLSQTFVTDQDEDIEANVHQPDQLVY